MLHIWQEPNYLPEDDDDEMWDALQRDLYSWFKYSFKILNDEKQSKFHPEISEAILVSALNARNAGFKIPVTFTQHILSCLDKYYVDPSKEKKPTLEKSFGLPKPKGSISKQHISEGIRYLYMTREYIKGYKDGEKDGYNDKEQGKRDRYQTIYMDEFLNIDRTNEQFIATKPYQRYGHIIGYEYGYSRSVTAKLLPERLKEFLINVEDISEGTAEERIKTHKLWTSLTEKTKRKQHKLRADGIQ